ncbi:hypothetical protein KY339_04055 [Candidatus Woesearchaeota archaeon]|nr:hypothetical protein [Candidatus Woesearchaeota archaeon]
MYRLLTVLGLSALITACGSDAVNPPDSNCYETPTNAAMVCLIANDCNDPGEDVLRNGADETMKHANLADLVCFEQCEIDLVSFLYDLETCFGGLPKPVIEEDYGNCQTQAANSSFTPESNRCVPDNQEERPYDEFFWIVEMSNLRSIYCSPENEEPVVIGENAFPSDVVTATDILVGLKNLCSTEPDFTLDSEVESLFSQDRIIVGTYESNDAIQELYGSREEFDAEVIGPAVIGRKYGDTTITIVTGQTPEDVRKAGKEFAKYL